MIEFKPSQSYRFKIRVGIQLGIRVDSTWNSSGFNLELEWIQLGTRVDSTQSKGSNLSDG